MTNTEIPVGEDSSWREEVAVRLDRYRARRKIRPPRYASLELPFAPEEPSGHAGASGSMPAAFKPVSEHTLALDSSRLRPAAPERAGRDRSAHTPEESPICSPGPSGAKILEFPRLAWALPLPPPDQLAEPVISKPRILEVPEVLPPPPALGGITIGSTASNATDKQPGIDTPLAHGSLPRRILACVVDGLLIALATGLFGFVFWKVAAVRPPRIQLFSLALGMPCVFWAAYQYFLIVYSGSTLGMRVAGLELVRFDGTSTKRALRRWRVLASYLSGASLGMGFAWIFLDEDTLCWHDRITRTYFAPRKRPGKR